MTDATLLRICYCFLGTYIKNEVVVSAYRDKYSMKALTPLFTYTKGTHWLAMNMFLVFLDRGICWEMNYILVEF
jgi:hypothetical protein